ncbi:MAG: hypothetical protein V4724_26075 [Pseudomonadota bacterium]
MAVDKERESDAVAWCNALAKMSDEISKADMLAVENAIRVHLGMPK